MSKFFTRRAAGSKKAPDYVKRIQRGLEREIERELAVMCIAMPFLPKDQVRGIVLKKLDLETGKSLLRKGGARIDYKKISLNFPESPEEQRATRLESPRRIRKKVLGRSVTFNIIRHHSAVRNNQGKESTNDTFGFNQASPINQAPASFKRKTPRSLKQRQKKKLKRRLYTLSENEDDILLEGDEATVPMESLPTHPPKRNICDLTPKRQTEEGQPPQRNQTAQIRSTEQEPLSNACHPVDSDSEKQIAETFGFTHHSTDNDNDDPSNLQSRRDGAPAVSDNGDLLMENNPSPVLNVKSSRNSTQGRLDQATKSTTDEKSESEFIDEVSPILEKKRLGRAKLSLSRSNGTGDKRAERRKTNSGIPRSVSPTPASAILPVRGQSFNILEVLDSPEEMLMDAAVVPTTPSDAANSSITPPTGGNTRSDLVCETPGKAARTPIVNAEYDGSGKLPGSYFSKDIYSGTPLSSLTAKSFAHQEKRSFIQASPTLWRHRATTNKDSPGGKSMMSSTSHGSLKLQEKNNSPASSGRSAERSFLFSSCGSVDEDHTYCTPESSRAVRRTNESSPCLPDRTPDPTLQSAVLSVRDQSNHILEVLDSPEEMLIDGAVVPNIPSDGASTSISSPTRGNTRNGGDLVRETPSKAGRTRIINAQYDDSDKLPGSHISRDIYSGTPQSSLTAKSFAHQGKSPFISASRTLWRHRAATKNDSQDETSMSSTSHGSLKNDSPESSGRSDEKSSIFSSRGSVDKDQTYCTPESARAGRLTKEPSPCFTTSIPHSVSSWSGLNKTPAENTTVKKHDHSLTTPETARAAGQQLPVPCSLSSTSSTSQSAFQIPSQLHPAWERDRTTENRSSVRGSSYKMSTTSGLSSRRSNLQETPNNSVGSGNKSAVSSIYNDYDYSSLKSVTPREPSSPGSENSSSLPPYPAWRGGSSEKDAAYYSPERHSSAEISAETGSSIRGSYLQAETNVPGKTSDGGPIERGHIYSPPKSVQSVTPREPSSSGSKRSNSPLVPLPPYPAWRRESSAKDAVYYSSERNSSAEISIKTGSSIRGSYPPAETSDGGSIEGDHIYSSPKSVQSITPRPSSSGSKRSDSPLVPLPPYPAWRGGSSAKDATYNSPERNSSAESSSWHLSNRDQQLYSSSTEDTPTSMRLRRGRSIKRGISRINHLPNQEMTARRMLFQGEDFAPTLDHHQGKDAEEPALSQDLFLSLDRDLMEISDDGNNHFKNLLAPASQKHISVVPLLLKKGADRLDGLPFPSGEAVRPYSAEWLHQKKLDSLPDSPTTVTRRSSRRDLNVWGSTEACLVVKTINSQRVQPSQQTSPLLFSEEQLELTGETTFVTFSPEQKQEQEQWWKEDCVMRALSQLGVEDIVDAGLDATLEVPSSKGSVQRSLPSWLSQEDRVQSGDSLWSSQESVSRVLE